MYALSIGFNQDPLNEKDFEYTYEKSIDFKIFPTIGVCRPYPF